MTRIFVANNPGFLGNKGDAAIVLGMCKIFEKLGITEVSLLSENPKFDAARCNARIISAITDLSKGQTRIVRMLKSALIILEHVLVATLCRIFALKADAMRVKKREIWEAYCTSDVIVTGLDDSFTTLYGPYGFIDNFYSVFLAKLLRKPVVVFAGSVGPFKNRIYRIFARYILNKVDLIMLREDVSYKYLQKIGVNKRLMYVTADLGFILQPATIERVKEIMTLEGINKNGRPLIGFSVSQIVSRWCFPKLKNLEEKYDRYVKMMAKVVEYLTKELSATVVFVPHSIGIDKKTDDRIVAEDIYQIVKDNQNVRLITNEYTPEELKGLIGQCDLFIGARTHSVIDAATMHVPFIALSYLSHKTHGIIGKALEQEELICDVKMLDFDMLRSKINYVWSTKEEIKRDLRSRIEVIKERAWLNCKLFQNFLNPFIRR